MVKFLLFDFFKLVIDGNLVEKNAENKGIIQLDNDEALKMQNVFKVGQILEEIVIPTNDIQEEKPEKKSKGG